MKDFEDLSDLRISRCFKPPSFGEVVHAQLHFFSDAAEKAGYDTVGYTRLVNNEGKIHCSLLIGKVSGDAS